MFFRYYTECWVYPQSGFDIIRKNKTITIFKNTIFRLFSGNIREVKNIEKLVQRFCQEHEGMVLLPLVLESDTKIIDPKKELMPEIHKRHPEAKLVNCRLIPEIVM